MRVHSEVRLSLVILLAVQVATTLAAVGLFARMAPAIERILTDNEFSVNAADDMLAVLAECPGTAPCNQEDSFRHALARARTNITEEAERPLTDAVERDAPLALAGDSQARSRVLGALRELAEINRASMVAADAEAKRLGTAGGWAAVLLGVSAFAVALVFGRRLHRRVVGPASTLERVARAACNGDLKRRVHVTQSAAELEAIGVGLNQLLDHIARQSVHRDGSAPSDWDRAVLLHLLDQQSAPQLVVDRQTRTVLAANRLATERLVDMGDAEHADLLDQLVEARVEEGIAKVDILPGDRLLVAELASGASDVRVATPPTSA